MVSQNPQPEIYTTRHSFLAGDTQGTTITQQINTSQSWNEDVRVYGIMLHYVGANGATLAYTDPVDTGGAVAQFDISIQAGPNSVPSTAFSASQIYRKGDKTLALSSPILVLHRQPLQVTVTYDNAAPINAGKDVTLVVTLLAEMYIQNT